MKAAGSTKDLFIIAPPDLNIRRLRSPRLSGLSIAASIGSVGDAYDNALAGSTIGLFKTEVISRNSPFRVHPAKTVDDIEYATMEWVDRYDNRRLHSVLGYIPPDEFEATYDAQPAELQPEPPPA